MTIISTNHYKKLPTTYALIGINVMVWIILEFFGGSTDTKTLVELGALTSLHLKLEGEYWRLLTSMFLHIGVIHLLVNCLSLFIIGSMTERIFGSFPMLLIYVMSGFCGGSVSYAMLGPFSVAAGASGAVFGCLGSVGTYFLLRKNIMGEVGRQSFNAVLMLAGINFIFGIIVPSVDNWAHIGGFIGGTLIGFGLVPKMTDTFIKSHLNPMEKWLTPFQRILVGLIAWGAISLLAIKIGNNASII